MMRNEPDINKTSNQLLDEAYDNYRSKNYRKAVELFSSLNNFDAKIGLARCYIKMQQNEDALKLLKSIKLVGLYNNQNQTLFYTMAIAYEQQEEFDEARRCLLKIQNQNHADTQYAWARLLGSQEQYEEAIKIYIKIKKNNPTHINSYLSHAVILHSNELYQEAINSLTLLCADEKKVKNRFPNIRLRKLAAAYVITSIAYSDLAKNSSDHANQLALYYARKAIQTDPTYAISWATCGHCYIKQKDQPGAVKKARYCFDQATHLDPYRFNTKHPLYKKLRQKISMDSSLDDYLFQEHLRILIDCENENNHVLDNNTNQVSKVVSSISYLEIARRAVNNDAEQDDESQLTDAVQKSYESMFPPLNGKSVDNKQNENTHPNSYKNILMKSRLLTGNKKSPTVSLEEISGSKVSEMNNQEWWSEPPKKPISFEYAEAIVSNLPANVDAQDDDDSCVPDSWEDAFPEEEKLERDTSDSNVTEMNNEEWWNESSKTSMDAEATVSNVPANVDVQDDSCIPDSWEDAFPGEGMEQKTVVEQKEEKSLSMDLTESSTTIINHSEINADSSSLVDVVPKDAEMQQAVESSESTLGESSHIIKPFEVAIDVDQQSDQEKDHHPYGYITSMVSSVVYSAVNRCKALLFNFSPLPPQPEKDNSQQFKKNM